MDTAFNNFMAIMIKAVGKTYAMSMSSPAAMINVLSDSCKVSITKDIDVMGFCVIWNQRDEFKGLIDRSMDLASEKGVF